MSTEVQNKLRELVQLTSEQFLSYGFAELIACVRAAQESDTKSCAEVATELMALLGNCDENLIGKQRSQFWVQLAKCRNTADDTETAESEVLTRYKAQSKEINQYYIKCVYTLFGDATKTFLRHALKKGFKVCRWTGAEGTEVQKQLSTMQVACTQVSWTEEAELWKACVINTELLLYPTLYDIETPAPAAEVEKGPFALFKEKLQGQREFYKTLQATMYNCVKERCNSWMTKTPLGMVYLDGCDVCVKSVRIGEQGRPEFFDADLQVELYPSLLENLQSLVCILDEYAKTMYGDMLGYDKITVLKDFTIKGMIPSTGMVYLPALQCCLRNGIMPKVVEQKREDRWLSSIACKQTGLNISELQETLFDLFLYVLFRADSAVEKKEGQEFSIIDVNTFKTENPVQLRQATSSAAKALLREYGTSLFYGYSLLSGTDSQIEFAATFGGFLISNISPKTLTEVMSESVDTDEGTETRAKFWFNKSMKQMEVLPDNATLLSLSGNLITNVNVYYQKADFGYEANHRLYNRGLSKNTPICLGKLLDGGDFDTYDCLRNNMVGGLAIISGSRSGKGVCTNNLVGSLFARGYSVAYFDNKPEQSIAMWGFERTFNKKFKDVLQRPLRLVCLDLQSPSVAAYDSTPEHMRSPRMCKIYNIPEFIQSEDFRGFCNDNPSMNVLTNSNFFNIMRYLKGIHLVAGLVNLKSHGTQAKRDVSNYCQQTMGRSLSGDYTYVVLDELLKMHKDTSAMWVSMYALVNFLDKEIAKLKKSIMGYTDTKREKYAELYAEEQHKLQTYKVYYGYFNNILRRYVPYGSTGNGFANDPTKYLPSDIHNMFKGMTSDTRTANVRFIAITQAICNKTTDYLPFGLYEQFRSWNIITGANYDPQKAGNSPFMLEEASNFDSVQDQLALVKGDLSVKFPGLSKDECAVSGYFTMRNSYNSSITVFKTYLTLMDNDYGDTKPGGGTYGLASGVPYVDSLLERTPSAALRDYILKNNVYSDYEKKELNIELGFGGATEWLMRKASNNDPAKLQEIVDGINTLYDELLGYLNFYVTSMGKPAYETLETYFSDMSYDSMYIVDENGVLTEPVKVAGLTNGYTEETSSKNSVDYGTNDDMVDFVDEGNTMSANNNESMSTNDMLEIGSTDSVLISDSTEYNDISSDIDATNGMSEDIVSDVFGTDNETVYEDTSNTFEDTADEFTQTTEVEQTAYNNVSSNNSVNASNSASAVTKSDRIKNVPNFSQAPTQQYAAPLENAETFNFGVFDNVTANTVYGRDQLTKTLLKYINAFAGGDNTLITDFKIDNAGHIYINNTLMAPQVSENVLQAMPPILRAPIKNKAWGDLFDCRRLYAFPNLRTINIAGSRSKSAGREMGVDDDWEYLLSNRTKRKYFPVLEHVIINGQEVTLDDEVPSVRKTRNMFNGLADNYKGKLNIGTVADKVWHKGPLKTCCKALGYGVGLKVFWGVASLLGPIGWLAAGLGTAAVAMNEFDKYKAEHPQAGSTRKQTDSSMFSSESTVKSKKTKKRKENTDDNMFE